ncbi:MAG: GT4 family glycosyltransferase PelF [Sphaerochaetaceae bacterium]|nr:GT4 family glycosyltransferase PelF [Sphaerochaetaceae bacterium]MDC7250169.1 GT4 family glycosyltransferase PelF [Sphaerochaetaceae bacterium]
MTICMIAEGSYPYVAGGVSSWINQIILAFPEHTFKVVSIMPSSRESVKYKYNIPENVEEIKTIFLDDFLKIKHRKYVKNIILTRKEKTELINLIRINKNIDWTFLIKFFSNTKRIGSCIDFLQSKFFFDECINFYHDRFSKEVFNNYFWTIRNMLLPLIYLMQQTPIKADIYHSASTGYAGILATTYSIKNNKPFLLSEHGIYGREREEELLKAKWVTGVYKKFWIEFFYSISNAAYQRASMVTSLFDANRQIQLKLGVNKRKTKITPNGINYEKLNIEKVEHDGINVGAILRVVPIKDIMTMIRAFSIVKSKYKDVKFYLIGPTEEDSSYYQQCVNLVNLLNLQESVIFTGRVNIKEYLGKIDILVLTSISEGQPLVILEGWAAKIPFISTDVGSCRELLQADKHEGDCGIVTKLASPSDTAKAILKLINNPKLRKEMGENGLARVKRLYNDKVLIESYRKLYNCLYKHF